MQRRIANSICRACRTTRAPLPPFHAGLLVAIWLLLAAETRSENIPASVPTASQSRSPAVDKTESALREELRILEAQNPGSIEVAKDLDLLAHYYFSHGWFSDAEPPLIRSLSIKEKILPADDSATQETVLILGEIYAWQGRLPEAERLFDRAIGNANETDASNPYLAARAHNGLGWIYVDEGRQQKAEATLKEGIEIRQRVLQGPRDILLAWMHRTLASLYCQEGRFDEADALATEAVKAAASESQSLRYASALGMLADAYYGEGRYADAERLYSESGAILLRQLGDAHMSYEQNLGSLGLTLAKEGKVSAARDAFRKAWAVNLNAGHSMTQLGSECGFSEAKASAMFEGIWSCWLRSRVIRKWIQVARHRNPKRSWSQNNRSGGSPILH